MPMVYLSYTKVIGKWSMWALLVPRSHDYNFMFVDSAGKIQHDDLLNFARK